jgi:hypothetical protein
MTIKPVNGVSYRLGLAEVKFQPFLEARALREFSELA